ncbi:hypothetical protein H6F74_23995 [Trichocoleus sp. FACHB-90]|uniref:hypothetical protein n=1 Tax=Cyanophyceae TaxID=3028117 RepID=UPI001682734D|nr:hypothetical protein [Trichocoleus sp. FACHB-90]MBD1929277.1 hypothetical protein [Trichocoleus sp. FACHB-90]
MVSLKSASRRYWERSHPLEKSNSAKITCTAIASLSAAIKKGAIAYEDNDY